MVVFRDDFFFFEGFRDDFGGHSFQTLSNIPNCFSSLLYIYIMLSIPFHTCQQPFIFRSGNLPSLPHKYMGFFCSTGWVHWKHYLLLLLMFLSAICAEGRVLSGVMVETGVVVEEEKILLRGRTGSRPPACERRCGSCGRCEPVQIPSTPQTKERHSSMVPTASSRDEGRSNYKPVNWKCKCGDMIFNP